jgi:hypothetical protein
MLAKIDIKFLQDWSPLITKYQKFDQMLSTKPVGEKYIEGYLSPRFDFGNQGSLILFNHIVSGNDTAGAICGCLVETELPWVGKLKNNLAELNLVSIAFQRSVGSLAPHVDGQEYTDTTFHCALNYIIDDFDACTYVQDGDNILSYPSKKNTAWLLDTTKLHWVNGSGSAPRYVFQLRFHQKHSEVLDWFNCHPGLIYSF